MQFQIFLNSRNSKYHYKYASNYINNKTCYAFFLLIVGLLFSYLHSCSTLLIIKHLGHFFGCWFATCIICSYSLKGKYYSYQIQFNARQFTCTQTSEMHTDCSLFWSSDLISYSQMCSLQKNYTLFLILIEFTRFGMNQHDLKIHSDFYSLSILTQRPFLLQTVSSFQYDFN